MIHSPKGLTEHFKIISFLLLLKASNLFHKRSEYSCNAVLCSQKNRRSYHTANHVFHFLRSSLRKLIWLAKQIFAMEFLLNISHCKFKRDWGFWNFTFSRFFFWQTIFWLLNRDLVLISYRRFYCKFVRFRVL